MAFDELTIAKMKTANCEEQSTLSRQRTGHVNAARKVRARFAVRPTFDEDDALSGLQLPPELEHSRSGCERSESAHRLALDTHVANDRRQRGVTSPANSRDSIAQ